MSIDRVLVAGAGAMGTQIAMVCAFAGYETTLYDVDDAALERSVAALRERTETMVAKGRRTAEDVAAAHARLATSTALPADTDLVISRRRGRRAGSAARGSTGSWRPARRRRRAARSG